MSDPTVNWLESYSPGEAERGKFIPIDTASLATLGYPASGRGKFALLTYTINASGSGGSSSVSVTNTLTTQIIQPDSMVLAGGANSLFGVAPATINFAPPINMIEIYNNSANTAYVLISGSVSFNTLTAQGIPILKASYYSLERQIASITLAADAPSSDIRIYGHYKS